MTLPYSISVITMYCILSVSKQVFDSYKPP